jgi:hypothetical protein
MYRQEEHNIIFSLHSNINIGHLSNHELFCPKLYIYIYVLTICQQEKYGKRVALTTGKRTMMWGIQSGSIRNGNKISKTIKPEEKSIWKT